MASGAMKDPQKFEARRSAPSFNRDFRAWQENSCRRSRQPSPRLPRRRRHTAGNRPRKGRASLRCGRSRIHRLCVFLGRLNSRPRASGHCCVYFRSSVARHQLRHDFPARNGAWRENHEGNPFGRNGSLRELRNRSRHVCRPPGARFHQARSDRQIRGMLPWPFRRLPFRSGLRACHTRHLRVSRRSRCICSSHPEYSVQRSRSRGKHFQKTSRRKLRP